MTESDWLACSDPTPMLEFLRGKVSDRKLRLFACGCYRLLPQEYTSGTLAEACAAAEGHADGQTTTDVMNRRRSERVISLGMTDTMRTENKIRDLLLSPRRVLWQAAQEFAAVVVRLRAEAIFGDFRPEVAESIRRQKVYDRANVASLIADLFGNPFRPATLDPSWLTSTVVTLARGVYEGRDFSAMPILADAMQDAGCDAPDILDHCRGLGPHARGCWVIDLLLGKG